MPSGGYKAIDLAYVNYSRETVFTAADNNRHDKFLWESFTNNSLDISVLG